MDGIPLRLSGMILNLWELPRYNSLFFGKPLPPRVSRRTAGRERFYVESEALKNS